MQISSTLNYILMLLKRLPVRGLLLLLLLLLQHRIRLPYQSAPQLLSGAIPHQCLLFLV